MKKFTGNYTSEAGKALKNADRLFCRIDEDGMVYICTGYFVYRMHPLEYAATVQQVTRCEAGNWNIERGEKREAGPADFDVVKTFRDTVKSCTGSVLDRFPGEFPLDKGGVLVSYYSASADFAAFYNRLYMAALAQGLTIKANGATHPAVFFDANGEAVAMVLPVKAKAETARAVKAYFTEQPAEDSDNAAEFATLRAELDSARNDRRAAEIEREEMLRKIAEQAAELETLRAELDKLHAEQAAAPVEQAADEKPAEDAKSAAEIIATRFAGLDGVRAVIKGAQTAAPVVWLTGNTEKHADAIRAAGAKWSGKRSAYYIRVA